MIYYLFNFFKHHGSHSALLQFFSFLRYTSVRAVLAFFVSLLVGFLIAGPTIRFLRKKKIGQFVRELGPKSHYEKTGTPTMGGILILFPTLVSSLLIIPFNNPLFLIALAAFLGFGFLGFLDDYLKLVKKNNDGLSAKKKLFGQLFLSTILAFFINHYISSDLYIPFKALPLTTLSYLFFPFAVFVIISWSNAVNLADGLDGLAGGLSAFLIITVSFFAYFEGNSFIASYLAIPYVPGANDISIFTWAILGSLVVFLWYNFFPAQVFMGDTGSLALGGIVGTLSLILKKEFILIFTGIIFVIEALSVVIQVLYYKRTKKRFFKMAPLHHHFELSGVPETKIVIRFWIIGIFLALLSLATLKFN